MRYWRIRSSSPPPHRRNYLATTEQTGGSRRWGGVSLGLQWQDCEVCHSPPSNARRSNDCLSRHRQPSIIQRFLSTSTLHLQIWGNSDVWFLRFRPMFSFPLLPVVARRCSRVVTVWIKRRVPASMLLLLLLLQSFHDVVK